VKPVPTHLAVQENSSPIPKVHLGHGPAARGRKGQGEDMESGGFVPHYRMLPQLPGSSSPQNDGWRVAEEGSPHAMPGGGGIVTWSSELT